MAIMLPALGKAREAAKRTMCGNNLRNIWIATNFYANDYRGRVSPKYTQRQSGFGNELNWYELYSAYIPYKCAFECPSFARDEYLSDEYYTSFDPSGGELAGRKAKVTYTINQDIALSSDYMNRGFGKLYTIEEIQRFAAKDHWMGIFIADGFYSLNNYGNWKSQQKFGADNGRASYRHSGKATFLSTDGMIGYYSEKDSLALPRHGYQEITPSMLK